MRVVFLFKLSCFSHFVQRLIVMMAQRFCSLLTTGSCSEREANYKGQGYTTVELNGFARLDVVFMRLKMTGRLGDERECGCLCSFFILYVLLQLILCLP